MTHHSLLSDLTRPADLQQHDRGTGSVRQRHPVYVDLLPPVIRLVRPGKISRPGWLKYRPGVIGKPGKS